MNNLLNLINNGWDVHFVNQPKRIDGDWVVKITWSAKLNDKKFSCEWIGFDTAQECVDDFIKTANDVEKKLGKL